MGKGARSRLRSMRKISRNAEAASLGPTWLVQRVPGSVRGAPAPPSPGRTASRKRCRVQEISPVLHPGVSAMSAIPAAAAGPAAGPAPQARAYRRLRSSVTRRAPARSVW
jgi:hypothetical protein